MTAPDDVRILLVDDSPDKLLSIGTLLSGPGREIVAAKSGREALRHLLSGEFAVILLDINMPDMDGFETASLIRQRKTSELTPIIFITAYSDDMYSVRGYSIGAVDYIVTPVVPEVIQSKVSVFVELFRKTEQIRRQSESLERRASQLQRLTQASLAVNSAGSVSRIVRAVVEAASSILDARRVVLIPAPGEQWGKAPRNAGDEVPDLTAALVGPDGRTMGELELYGKDSASWTGEDGSILTQLAQIAAVAIENVLSAQAREANRLKDEFLATLSHELRTPLTAILGWARVLKGGAIDPRRHAHGLEVIERNVNAQAKLIEDLLEISRVSNSKVRLTARPMRVVAAVEAALDAMRPAIEAKGLLATLAVSPEAAEADRISGDPDRLQQVFGNLVSNAIKFTRQGGRIDVCVERTDSRIEVSISDTGRGISPEFLEHVFDRFRQEDSSPTRSHGGLGIGLAIVRHLVDLHHGTVSASSAGIGKGSTFTVFLPLLEEGREAPTPPRARELAGAVDLSGVRALIVDDDHDSREVVAEILGVAGVEVRSASTLREALELLGRERFDVLVSDIAMPEGDGYDLIRKVRALPPEKGGAIPAVALTAYVGREDRLRARREGFQTHVSKPIEPGELLSVLEKLTGARRDAGATASRAEGGEPCRVLIVEDDADSGLGLKALLELGGFEVEIASDGPEGLRKAADLHPDLALVDVSLPGMDGYDVAERLRRSGNDGKPYMIAVSGFDDGAHRERARESGFDDYLVKPIRPDELERAVSARTPRARPKATAGRSAS
ncbi:MAG: response regulator [Thermoanaerobaculia bacterium]